MSTLLIAFGPADLPALTNIGSALGAPFDVLLLSGQGTAAGANKNFAAGFESVPASDGLAKALAKFGSDYQTIGAISSMSSKDLIPRLAGILDRPFVSEVTKIEGPNEFIRPCFAGSIFEAVKVKSQNVLLTFRASGFLEVTVGAGGESEPVSFEIDSKVTIGQKSSGAAARPDLTQADLIVSGGRPLKDSATFETVIGGFADQFGGAVGATRAAVDSGIAPNELQVGQTGKIVAPNLYIAAGISGSTQHMAGIKDSKVIVAINKDAAAPIFDQADFGLVADLYEALPALAAALKSAKA